MFKINESNGNWKVGRDAPGVVIKGTPIPYELYQELRSRPHEAGKYFKRDARGKLVEKPTGKQHNNSNG